MSTCWILGFSLNDCKVRNGNALAVPIVDHTSKKNVLRFHDKNNYFYIL